MKIVYMGTPDFAVPALETLINSRHEVTAVFTQPDKPKGRKMILTPPDVKVCAQKHGVKVYQPASMRSEEAVNAVKELAPDVIVVAAYGQILPQSVLDIPKYGCVNIHGSLLPKYRGAAPIQQAVLNGDKVTGLTTMLMDIGLDTSGELFDRLAQMGGELILNTLDALENGTVVPKKQDESKAVHTSKIDKSMCPIDFSKSADEVHNLVRGLNPWPVATAVIGGKKMKIYSTAVVDKNGEPGKILSLAPFVIACGEKAVEIKELQPEGKKRMTAQAFLLGHKLNIGDTIS